jgi:hypothetical protein
MTMTISMGEFASFSLAVALLLFAWPAFIAARRWFVYGVACFCLLIGMVTGLAWIEHRIIRFGNVILAACRL